MATRGNSKKITVKALSGRGSPTPTLDNDFSSIREREIPANMTLLDGRIGELEDRFAQLNERLNFSVLAGELVQGKADSGNHPGMPSTTPFGGQLNNYSTRIACLIMQMENTIERLEV